MTTIYILVCIAFYFSSACLMGVGFNSKDLQTRRRYIPLGMFGIILATALLIYLTWGV